VSVPLSDEQSYVVIVIGPVVIGAVVGALLLWLRARSLRKP
jgi:hypothetical protein